MQIGNGDLPVRVRPVAAVEVWRLPELEWFGEARFIDFDA